MALSIFHIRGYHFLDSGNGRWCILYQSTLIAHDHRWRRAAAGWKSLHIETVMILLIETSLKFYYALVIRTTIDRISLVDWFFTEAIPPNRLQNFPLSPASEDRRSCVGFLPFHISCCLFPWMYYFNSPAVFGLYLWKGHEHHPTRRKKLLQLLVDVRKCEIIILMYEATRERESPHL